MRIGLESLSNFNNFGARVKTRADSKYRVVMSKDHKKWILDISNLEHEASPTKDQNIQISGRSSGEQKEEDNVLIPRYSFEIPQTVKATPQVQKKKRKKEFSLYSSKVRKFKAKNRKAIFKN